MFTLFMGSWWAYQEGSWGGWWNWDPSEVFGLLILLGILLITHNYLFNSRKNIFIFIILSLFYLTLTYYSFMQVNFTLISHNFGFRNNDLLDVKNFYLLIIFFITVQLYLKLVFMLSTYMFSKPSVNYNVYSWSKLVILVTFSFVIITPLLYLVNDFIWRLLQLNISNFSFTYTLITISLVLVYSLAYPSTMLLSYVFIFATPLFSFSYYWYLCLASFPLLIRLQPYYFHYFILVIFLYTIEYSFYTFSSWSLNQYSYVLYNFNTVLGSSTYSSLNYPYINSYCNTSILNDTCMSYLYFTSPETKHFNLCQTYYNSTQTLLSDYNSIRYALDAVEYILGFVTSLLFFITLLYKFSTSKFLTVL
jgi:hypothetical protein